MSIRNNAIAALLAFAAPMLSAPVMAADGEILINQAAVNAGGISPGDTAGFPATISRPGRYKLSGNLVVPANMTGIEVTTNDVTLDLNGFTIRGTANSSYYGIVANIDTSRLRVANGTITGFSITGIEASSFSVIDNMRLVANDYGMRGKENTRITNSTIANNGSRGIECFPGCSVERSIIAGTVNTGIYFPAGGGVVLGNVIVGNGGFGLSSSGAATGYGQNIFVGNAGQVFGASQLHPNVCEPACP